MDPALAHVCRGVLALVFLSAAAHKLRAPRDFLATTRGYGLVPTSLAPAVAVLLVGAELGAGAGLLAPATQRAAALAATALLGLYGAGIAINLLRGRRDIDCGCGGPAARQPLSAWLVLRNVGLAALGIAALLPSSGRPLGAAGCVHDRGGGRRPVPAVPRVEPAAGVPAANASAGVTTALLVSTLVLWIAVAVLAVVVFALVRQIGVLHQRIAPVGALMIGGGPKTGETVPVLELRGSRGLGSAHRRRERERTQHAALLPLAHLSDLQERCCRPCAPRGEASGVRSDLVLASDGELAAQRQFVAGHQLGDFPYVVSAQLGLTYQVGKLPVRRADRRARHLARARPREHARASREPLRGQGPGPGLGAGTTWNSDFGAKT